MSTAQHDQWRALAEVIRGERERHRNDSAEHHCFNTRCSCGHIGTTVSVRGEFEAHVDDCVARAVLLALSEGAQATAEQWRGRAEKAEDENQRLRDGIAALAKTGEADGRGNSFELAARLRALLDGEPRG